MYEIVIVALLALSAVTVGVFFSGILRGLIDRFRNREP